MLYKVQLKVWFPIAAHKVEGEDPANLEARVGEYNTEANDPLLPSTDHEIQEIVVHENFDINGALNNIALLFLKTAVTIKQHVNTICLPPQGANFDRSRCFATGWGAKGFEQNENGVQVLKKIELPVMPSKKCEAVMRTTRLTDIFELHESFICAGGEPGKGEWLLHRSKIVIAYCIFSQMSVEEMVVS